MEQALACQWDTLPYWCTHCSNSTVSSYRIYSSTLILLSIMSFLSTVTFLSVPDITQFNLACIPKACLLVCAKTLSTIALSDKVVSLTLCCQPASYIISSPSLGHVTPLRGDGCLPTKDSWVMAPILTSRRGKITRHSQYVCCRPEQMQRGRGSRLPSEKGMCIIEREQYAILSSFSTSTHIHLCLSYLFGTFWNNG